MHTGKQESMELPIFEHNWDSRCQRCPTVAAPRPTHPPPPPTLHSSTTHPLAPNTSPQTHPHPTRRTGLHTVSKGAWVLLEQAQRVWLRWVQWGSIGVLLGAERQQAGELRSTRVALAADWPLGGIGAPSTGHEVRYFVFPGPLYIDRKIRNLDNNLENN